MSLKRKPPPGNERRVISLGDNIRGVTTSKRGHLVQFESEQEHKLILLLERDATVADYLSQPETFRFQNEQGHPRHYTPDFQVWRTGGKIELHEVTLASRRANRESLQQREEFGQAICHERGWRYVVHTEQTLPSAQEYANLDCLSAFRALACLNGTLRAWLIEQLAGEGALHPHAILASAPSDFEPGSLLNTLYHLLWQGTLQMDWSRPLFWRDDFHPDARIWLPSLATVKEVTS